MTLEEIRKNAPEGATHYVDAAVIGTTYIKYIEGTGFYWHNLVYRWIKCNPNLEGIKPL